MVKELTNLDELKNILIDAGDQPVICDFWAEWCGPCKRIAPLFEILASEYGDKLQFYKVDIEEAEDIAEECNITGLPTFRVFRNCKKVANMTGADITKLTTMCKKWANVV